MLSEEIEECITLAKLGQPFYLRLGEPDERTVWKYYFENGKWWRENPYVFFRGELTYNMIKRYLGFSVLITEEEYNDTRRSR